MVAAIVPERWRIPNDPPMMKIMKTMSADSPSPLGMAERNPLTLTGCAKPSGASPPISTPRTETALGTST